MIEGRSPFYILLNIQLIICESTIPINQKMTMTINVLKDDDGTLHLKQEATNCTCKTRCTAMNTSRFAEMLVFLSLNLVAILHTPMDKNNNVFDALTVGLFLVCFSDTFNALIDTQIHADWWDYYHTR